MDVITVAYNMETCENVFILKNGEYITEDRYNKVKIMYAKLPEDIKTTTDITFGWIQIKYNNIKTPNGENYIEDVAVGFLNKPYAKLYSDTAMEYIETDSVEDYKEILFKNTEIFCYWGVINSDTLEEGWKVTQDYKSKKNNQN